MAGDSLSTTDEAATVHVTVVTDWNAFALTVVSADKVVNRQTRDMAMVHAAMFDAMNAIRTRYTPAMVGNLRVSRYASLEAAGAQAAHDVLVALFPAQAPAIDAQLATSLAAVPDDTYGSRSKANGIAAGQQAASAVLQLRANDHAFDTLAFTPPPPDPGNYQITPGCTAATISAPWWGTVTPFTGATPVEVPHPAIDSQEWLDALAEVQAYGASNSTVRTDEQTQIALFWLEPSLPSMNRAARTLLAAEAAQYDCSNQEKQLLAHARLFAALNMAQAETYIYTWRAKYGQLFWRPITAINSIDPNAAWTPLRQTPCHPEYYAAHGTLTGTGTGVLQNYFGDAIQLDATSSTLANVTRHYTSFDGLLDEVNRSRIYAGFHYRSTLTRSNTLGRSISSYIEDNVMKPLDDDGDWDHHH